MNSKKYMPTPCGLDCGPCSIRMIPIDSEAAQEAIDWFKSMGWLKENEGIDEAIAKGMYCKGCRSDREDVHWSPDCVILKCCVDEKKLEFCYECNDFICDHLREWANMGNHHKKAIENLKQMKARREQ